MRRIEGYNSIRELGILEVIVESCLGVGIGEGERYSRDFV
jgi:hypothetical protein